MEDTYQDDASQDSANQEDYYYQPEPRRGMSGWLIALIVILVFIVLCCICVCLGMLLAGPFVGDTFSSIIEEMTTLTPLP